MLKSGLPSERIAEYTKKMEEAYKVVNEMRPSVAPEMGGGENGGGTTSSGAGGAGDSEKLQASLEKLKEQFMSEEELRP